MLKNKFSYTFLRFSFTTWQSQNCNKDNTFDVNNEKLQFFFTAILHFSKCRSSSFFHYFCLFQVSTKAKPIFVRMWNSVLIPKCIKSFWKLLKGIKVQALSYTFLHRWHKRWKHSYDCLDAIWTLKKSKKTQEFGLVL